MKRTLIPFFFTFCILVTSCKTKNNIITFSPTSTIDISPDVNWALVTAPLATFRSNCDFESEVSAYGRNGETFPISGKKTVRTLIIDEEENLKKQKKQPKEQITVWYLLDPGWIDENQIQIYDTKLKAQNAISK